MNTPFCVLAASSMTIALSCSSAAEPDVPKPFIIAPECTEAQRNSAIAVAKPSEPVIACYFLQKWSYKGAALAIEPDGYAGRAISESDFYQLRKKVYREQSARLRIERDMKEAMPGEPDLAPGIRTP